MNGVVMTLLIVSGCICGAFVLIVDYMLYSTIISPFICSLMMSFIVFIIVLVSSCMSVIMWSVGILFSLAGYAIVSLCSVE